MTVHCPACGQPVIAGRAPMEALGSAPLSRMQSRIMQELIKAYPRTITAAQMIEAQYFDDPQGGPENPRIVLVTTLAYLRRNIADYGWTVTKGSKGGQGKIGYYRLEPLP